MGDTLPLPDPGLHRQSLPCSSIKGLPCWISWQIICLQCRRLLVIQDTQFRSLGWEDPLEKKPQPTLVPCLGNPMDRGAWRLQFMWLPQSLHDCLPSVPAFSHGYLLLYFSPVFLTGMMMAVGLRT